MSRRSLFHSAVALLCASTGLLAAGPQRQTPSVPGSRAEVVRVAAAADLKFALDEVAARLVRQQPPVRIQPTYGSSGNMHAQLQQRAPFDLYLSADVEYPRDLVKRGVGSERDLFTYARGKLVVWVRKQSTLPVEREGWAALRSARRIAIANPRHAPYGRAAEQALRGAGLWRDEDGRIVLGENVAQAAQFVDSGAADVGLIAKSLALAPAMRSSGRFWEVPENAYMPLQQGGLILPWAVSRDAALRVRDYLLSDTGRTLLASYGFALPEN
jgi:molybdate transport system substrate-binding protein